jgi:hypothetical protein
VAKLTERMDKMEQVYESKIGLAGGLRGSAVAEPCRGAD